jgi:transglutaminase-like putative cysteine protease
MSNSSTMEIQADQAFGVPHVAGSDSNEPRMLRVRLHYSVELNYEISGPAELVLNVHAARIGRQRVIEENFQVIPACPVKLGEDPESGNRMASFAGTAGAVTARYDGLVEIAHRIVNVEDVVAETPGALPASMLHFIFPSRYCQTDLIQQQAWDRFGQMERGYPQVRAVRDWVNGHLTFQVGVSGPGTSVVDTLRERKGVCRDFAHTMITFCRALNYPARFVTGVDYGADPSLGPPDFHAYVEVYIGGHWYLFDPAGLCPITGLVRIGTGRDAADVSFATIFGPVKTGMPRISFSAVDDCANGFALPFHTDLAVSTA